MLVTKKLLILFCEKYTFFCAKYGYLLILMSKLINNSQHYLILFLIL